MKQLNLALILSTFVAAVSLWAVIEKSTDLMATSETLIPVSLSSNHDRPASRRPYAFTMVLPERTGEKFSLLSLSLDSSERGATPIPFEAKSAQAFVEANGQKQKLTIQQSWIDETGTLWIEFKPSLMPKTQLTLSLVARELSVKAVYKYGIAAYADSDYPMAILVDSGVITIQ